MSNACGCTLTSTGKPCSRPADVCASEDHLVWRRAIASQRRIKARQRKQARREAEQAKLAAANPFAALQRR